MWPRPATGKRSGSASSEHPLPNPPPLAGRLLCSRTCACCRTPPGRGSPILQALGGREAFRCPTSRCPSRDGPSLAWPLPRVGHPVLTLSQEDLLPGSQEGWPETIAAKKRVFAAPASRLHLASGCPKQPLFPQAGNREEESHWSHLENHSSLGHSVLLAGWLAWPRTAQKPRLA